MPTTPTYPGVYIEEIPSGVRTIMGVATSITAFIGRALRGPVDEPITINSFGDFERTFGGLWVESKLSYAVRDFYLNGGAQAVIVRMYRPTVGENSIATLDAGGLVLGAAYPGAWGNYLRARVDDDVSEDVAESYTNDGYDIDVADLFNLTVCDTKTGSIEQFRNVTVKESPRKVDLVLTNESQLVRADTLPATAPTAHGDPTAGNDIWADDNASTGVVADRAYDGTRLDEGDFTGPGKETGKKGLYALQKADIFNLLCIPPYKSDDNIDSTLVGTAAKYCEDRRAMLLVDPPSDWIGKDDAKDVESVGTKSKNAALFFPRLKQPNSLRDNQVEEFVPCGAVAGIFARTDTQRGVWKAPAGLEATLVGVPQLSVPLTDAENGELNPLGINCLRAMPAVGRVVWGSRTLKGDDRLASEWKYIPVRRLALYLEESLYRGTQWVVFEPNDEPLWSQIRLNIGAFMHTLFRQGAFQGTTPKDAYFVKCDKETTTQDDINRGIVNIVVGFAPLKPAEFVIIKIQQMAGEIQT
ncbi:MAG TPA: phage tail sheath family protein [Methanosarcinales archaeon]|nr:MAG: phage tail sheath family protein [Methanosarcinales archaeon]HDN65366.1 phage tail sheath family protein [Methanosarcinales archaeon]